jgi:hypothetical protein
MGLLLFIGLAVSALFAAEHSGEVTFHGVPVPGATVTALGDGKTLVASTDEHGRYSFSDLAEGTWQIEVEMFGFAKARRDIAVAPAAPPAQWELTLLSLDEIKATPYAQPVAAVASATAAASAAGTAGQPVASQKPLPKAAEKASEQTAEVSPQTSNGNAGDLATDGLLINGSANNGGDTPFAQSAAFGNFRKGRSLYNGGLGLTFDNSALDAQSFTQTGEEASKPSYNRLTGTLNFGGPLHWRRVFKQNPFYFLTYQWSRNSNATTQPALVPTPAEREGIFSQPIVDPVTGAAFANNTIPGDRISSQAQALLHFYPLPDSANSAGYNYQIPLLTSTHSDSLQGRIFNLTVGRKDSFNAQFLLNSTRTSTPNLFGFVDTSSALGTNSGVSWQHTLNRKWQLTLGYNFSRQATRLTPYFAERTNVSGDAMIAGNSQEPRNWGPPSLSFSSGLYGLSDAQSSWSRNQTSRVSYSMNWYGAAHHVVLGGNVTRSEFNDLGEPNPRGRFSFFGSATGNDFADFLLGIPSTASLTLGNASTHFRETLYAAYLQDEWKVRPGLSIAAGLRWEYAAPVTELNGHMANLDITPDFTAAAPLLASNPSGPLTGKDYPRSLVESDKDAIQPRIGIAWRPVAGSSVVVRSGYGIYYDTPVYQTIARQMAQQPPLSTTLNMQNRTADPWTMENAFLAAASSSTATFAVDPRFRMGYAQNWNLSVQKNLPGALQITTTYQGIKGTHAPQEFLPNTNPIGAVAGCPSCPAGFVYLTAGGNSTRQAGILQLRRRLRSGLTATSQYTFSKSIDDASALGSQSVGGGLPVAQDWRNLRGERSLSSFDQRHLFNFQMQYTSGMGVAGGTLLRGWLGGLFKQWTVSSQLAAGSGLPETPVYLAAVPGSAVSGTIRPDITGASLYAAPAGLYLNPAAFKAPQPGAWGTAGRNCITGPATFTLNASLRRAFRLRDKYNLDLGADASNLLNHVTYTAWNTNVNSSQFGLPATANAMRAIQTTLRLRF